MDVAGMVTNGLGPGRAGVRFAGTALQIISNIALCIYVVALILFAVSVFAPSAAWLPPLSAGIVIVSVTLFACIVVPLSLPHRRGRRPDALLRAAMSSWWTEQPGNSRSLTLVALGIALILIVVSILTAPQHAGLVQRHGGYFLSTDQGLQAVSQSRYLLLSVARYTWSPLSAALLFSTVVRTMASALRFRWARCKRPRDMGGSWGVVASRWRPGITHLG